MSLLTDADLDFMRDALEDLLPDTCHILSVTEASDGQGGITQTWGTATASVACRLDAGKRVASSEQVDAAALQPYSFWWLTLPYDTTIGAGNRVVHGGATYNVEFEDSGKSWKGTVRVAVTKI
jgi:hypothetical protein